MSTRFQSLQSGSTRDIVLDFATFGMAVTVGNLYSEFFNQLSMLIIDNEDEPSVVSSLTAAAIVTAVTGLAITIIKKTSQVVSDFPTVVQPSNDFLNANS